MSSARFSSNGKCPYCKSIDFRSADTGNPIETALLWLLHPYWCELCGHRFFLFRWHAPAGGAA